MYRTIPFKKEHLEVMDVREHEQELLRNPEHLAMLEQGVNCTGLLDGRVVCCGGVIPFLNGNADIWLIPSIYVEEYQKSFVKGLRKWLFSVREDLALTRMQSICMDDELHNKWMRFLGFEKEGVLKKYHNDKNYVMYGRTQWE